jgi:hypothetical protein
MTLNPVVTGVLDNVLGSPLVARDRYPGGEFGGFMDEIPRWENPITGQFEPIPGHRTEIAQNVFSPLLPWNWGKNQSVGKQVQQGTYEPEKPVVSPTDQFLRGVSNRNRGLQQIMDEAGW